MPNHSYDISKCTSLIKSEVIKLTIVASVLLILFLSVIVLSIIQIKNDKTKKLPYVQIVAALIIFSFLLISLGAQIAAYSKDLTENSYVEYTGAATITTRKQIIFGGIPTGYTEYVITFEHEGRNVELYMRKEPDLIGNVSEITIVYATNSNYIIDFDIMQ